MTTKRALISAALALFLLAALTFLLSFPLSGLTRREANAELRFRTNAGQIQQCVNGTWSDFEIKGVNMGTGYPDLFPNELSISRETYLRWFRQIGEMNANTIRVYQLQVPEFYSALAEYNETHPDKPVYLLQGADFSDHMIYSEKNLMAPKVHGPLFDRTRDIVDALHGDNVLWDSRSGDLHCYVSDVSDYVMGYVLGVEWEQRFVEYICRLNQHLPPYQGTYLTCGNDANAFEQFLAMWGDTALTYEKERYGSQKLMSFANWPDTDPIINKLQLGSQIPKDRGNQPDAEPIIDLERIHCTDALHSGLFASYNVYPYFPIFLQYGRYTQFVDDQGRKNPYLGYLKELTLHHKYPVVITEYGIPASRSSAYQELWHQFSHGGLDEYQQGHALTTLFREIRKAGCAGSIAFTWQDEWYKTIWNETLLSDPNQRDTWSNAQCAEQFFGLLTFEPGLRENACYPDGDLSDWEGVEPVLENGPLTLRMQSNEKYLYCLVEGLDAGGQVELALDVTPKSGQTEAAKRQYSQPVDFLLRVNGSEGAQLYVDRSYDVMAYSVAGGYRGVSQGSMERLIQRCAGLEKILPGSRTFVHVTRADGSVYSRLEKSILPSEAGFLKHGNANPASSTYDSNADYCLSGNAVEIRIPWQLLNFYDPSTCTIIDDIRENGYAIQGLRIRDLDIAVYGPEETQISTFGTYRLEGWRTPEFHERLKPSYYALQKAFGEAAS